MLKIDRRSEQIVRNMRQHPERARKGSMKGLWFAGKALRKDLQSKIKDRSEKTGRYYLYKGRRLRASSPGEFPANRSGKLRKSVGFDVNNSEEMEFGYRDSVDYGKWLETKEPKRGGRAALKRIVEKNELKTLNIVGREIYKEIIR
ncbi:hypothetical protein KAR91_10530 [Candidatus Pacearchaeota archaeon]|nr:hypothetical protein [Candidatus Pacearchaeota archaeon]